MKAFAVFMMSSQNRGSEQGVILTLIGLFSFIPVTEESFFSTKFHSEDNIWYKLRLEILGKADSLVEICKIRCYMLPNICWERP